MCPAGRQQVRRPELEGPWDVGGPGHSRWTLVCRGGLSLGCGGVREPLGLSGRPPPLESELCFASTFVSVAHGTQGQVVRGRVGSTVWRWGAERSRVSRADQGGVLQ